jgi:putative toxin-antitoxin system antitoxin component (TIGR02293 family)
MYGFPVDVVERLVAASGINQDDVLAVAGVSRALWRKRRAAGTLSCQESDRLYRLIRVFEQACHLFEGDTVAARRWLLSPALGLGDARPLDYLGTSAEFQCVLDLISRLETGELV